MERLSIGFPRASVRSPFVLARVLLLAAAPLAHAQSRVPPDDIRLSLSPQVPPLIHLAAKTAPLAQLLKELSAKTGITIHHSLLPSRPVTADCAGANVKIIIECLLGPRADLVARMREASVAPSDSPALAQITEIWLLPTDVAVNPGQTTAHAAAPAQETAAKLKPAEKGRRQLADILKAARSKNPEQRATAVYNLGLIGGQRDPAVTAALRRALNDQDANVRAQAAASLAQRGDPGALVNASQGNQDTSADAPPTAGNPDYQAIALLQKASHSNGEQAMAILRDRLPPQARKE